MADQIVWFRNDLRVADHPALAAAVDSASAQGGCVHAVYVCTPGQWRLHHWGTPKRAFIYRSVQALARALAQLNIPLHILRCEDFSQLPDTLITFARARQTAHIWWHRELGWHERERDAAVEREARRQGLVVHTLCDRFLVGPDQPLTLTGQAFKVFTPYKKRWLARLAAEPLLPVAIPKSMAKPVRAADVAPADFDLPHPAHLAELWPAGENEAHTRLRRFIEDRLSHYERDRDFPALEATSRLSPYLSAGVISARQCAHAWLLASEGDWYHNQNSSWLNELVWRDFYQYILWHYPKVSRDQPFVDKTRALRWRNNEADFNAWCEARTGIPLVDAAICQLRSIGWMHNRLRMVVAMFLTKNLLVDWRWGEAFFMEHLVDGDFAANNGGWQWSASTGTDAAPYFRVFNPVSQSKRFDPEGAFIRRWLPALRHLDRRQIHLPPAHLRGDYPAPLVDLTESRRLAIEAFAGL